MQLVRDVLAFALLHLEAAPGEVAVLLERARKVGLELDAHRQLASQFGPASPGEPAESDRKNQQRGTQLVGLQKFEVGRPAVDPLVEF